MENAAQSEPAILVRGVSKQYRKDRKVLDNLNMTVMKGTIYGLLGASGCGKTTLLNAILGTRKIQNGKISILGKAPEIVPAKSIGYMPQDIALLTEFTIKDVLKHQGYIFGMTDGDIEERHKFLEKLLDLPPPNKLIGKLSGGQQRRVSLAVALIQDPELLILDEPTVGLDPVLRQNLWDYFIKITKEEKKTVLVTTHYIEEAKQADMVGMLRHGKMLVEGNPEILINQFNSSSLENLFTTLSLLQNEKDPSLCDRQQQMELILKWRETKILSQRTPKKSLAKKLCSMSPGHMKALLSRNFIRYVRQPSFLIIALLGPIVQLTATFIAVGKIPNDLQIGVVNQELREYKNCEDYVNDNTIIGGYLDENRTCIYNSLGCKFLAQIQDVIPVHVYYESLEEAINLVKKGKIHNVLFFHQNFTNAFTEVMNAGSMEKFLRTQESSFGKINVHRGEIDYALGLHVEKQLYDSYQKFSEKLATDCHQNKHGVKSAIVFEEPIYGKPNMTYGEFLIPGMTLLISSILAMGISVLSILTEKRTGVWERTIISGIKSSEILISHTIATSLLASIQTVETFFFEKYVFDLECKGSMLDFLMLLYLQALVGIALGIFLSTITKTETEAVYGATAIIWPSTVLSGVMWPLEGVPTYLRYISYIVPTTIPLQSFNSIIFRGWDITNFHVYKGFLSSVGFIFFFTLLSILVLKYERK